jgi:anti-sigma regulatory factor (Ser/Thr protein kinase)
MSGGRIPGPRRPCGGVGRSSASRWSYIGGTEKDVARARAWFLREHRLQGGGGSWVELVGSELATNAVRHTASSEKYGRMGLSMEFLGNRTVLLGVLDQGSRWGEPLKTPQLVDRQPDEMNPGGRGLWLVDRIADFWWWVGEWGQPLYLRALIRLDREPDPGDLGLDPAS